MKFNFRFFSVEWILMIKKCKSLQGNNERGFFQLNIKGFKFKLINFEFFESVFFNLFVGLGTWLKKSRIERS